MTIFGNYRCSYKSSTSNDRKHLLTLILPRSILQSEGREVAVGFTKLNNGLGMNRNNHVSMPNVIYIEDIRTIIYLLRSRVCSLSSNVLIGSKQPSRNSHTSPLIDGWIPYRSIVTELKQHEFNRFRTNETITQS